MSDALIKSLEDRIATLTAQVATLNAEGKDRRKANQKLKGDLQAAQGQVEALTKERDDFKVKAESGPKEFTAKIAELEGKLTARDHADAFKGVKEFAVKARGQDGKDVENKLTLNDGVSIDDVWGALGYKAEGDTPDAAKVGELLGQAAASKPFLFKAAAGETPNAAPGGATSAIRTAAATAGPGASRSGANNPTSERLSAVAQIDATFGDRPAGRIA